MGTTISRASAAFLVASLSIALLSGLLIWGIEGHRRREARSDLALLVKDYAGAVERRLERSAASTQWLAALARREGGRVRDFETFGLEVLPLFPWIAALGLAPEGVVRSIVPLGEREGLIGHDILADPAWGASAARARDEGIPVLGGPELLLDGGSGAVIQAPVYLAHGPGGRRFWGFTIALIRFPSAIEDILPVGLEGRGIGYALSRVDPSSGAEQVIVATPSFSGHGAVARTVRVPGGEWTLSLSRATSWVDPWALTVELLAAVLLSLLAGALARATVRLREHGVGLEALVAGQTAELKEGRDFSDALLASLPGVFYLFDDQLRFLRWNRNLERVLGYDRDEILRLSPLDLFPEDQRSLLREHIGRVFAQGAAEMEADFLTKDGTRIPHYFTGVRTRSADRDCLLGIGIDITARKRSEEALRRLAAELEDKVRDRTAQLQAVNRELESFSYSVSHDLKAPLRGIDGYGRLLEEEHAAGLEPEGRLFVANIRKATAQMHELIEDLLAYSRLERRTLHAASLELRPLVDAVLAERREDVERDAAEVQVEVPPLSVRADREGLAVVLRNLVENALKFSRGARPPRIWIGARREGDRVIVSVRDNGIGFDMRFHDRIFEIFQRLQRSEDYPGTGIGLALVRKAAERMGGRVWAESAPGAGATFHVELPA